MKSEITQAFLNEQLHRCDESNAKFITSIEETGVFPNPKTLQTLHAFSSEMTHEAELLSEKTTCEPIKKASSTKESREIAGFEFVAVAPNKWVCQRRDCSIHLNATTDQVDAQLLLKAIGCVEEKILKREIAGKKPIEFHIGEEQWESQKNVASATHYDNHRKIRFFFAANQSHLLISKLEQSVGIDCLKIVLHEIGHGMDQSMPRMRAALEQTIIAKFEKAADFLNEISPHYLGKQFKAIVEETTILQQAIFYKIPKLTLLEKNQKTGDLEQHFVNVEPYVAHKAWRISDEIFAETLRTQYLEPCMKNEPPPKHRETGWESLDKLIEYLHREVGRTLMANHPTTPPFPSNDNAEFNIQ